MPSLDLVVHSDPEILGGTPVFQGTRVPLRNLIDYLERGTLLTSFSIRSRRCRVTRPWPRWKQRTMR